MKLLISVLLSAALLMASQLHTLAQSAGAVKPGVNGEEKGSSATGAGKGETEPLRMDFVISEPCSLLVFIDAISGRAHSTGWLRDWYFKTCRAKASKRELAEDRRLCKQFRAATANGNVDGFKDLTGNRILNLDQEILVLASGCSALSDLLPKLKSIVKEADYAKLKEVLEYFDPLYKKYLFNPRRKSLEQQLLQFKEQALSSRMMERLAQVQKFMQAPWVKGAPFTVVLVPLPDAGMKSTHGECLGQVQVVELLPWTKFKDQADVVFHEDCHALWQSKKDMDKIEKNFFDLPGGKVPYDELNEGMATALGQGWFMKEAFGKTANSWYADKVISGYAHALYPLFCRYLKEEKSIDSDFARQACSLFKRKFPGAENNIMFTGSFQIMADNVPHMDALQGKLDKLLPRLHSLSTSFPLADSRSIKSFKDDKSQHKTVLISHDKLQQLSALGFSSGQLAKLKALRQGTATVRIAGADVLVCIADSPESQQNLLLTVLSHRSWPACSAWN